MGRRPATAVVVVALVVTALAGISATARAQILARTVHARSAPSPAARLSSSPTATPAARPSPSPSVAPVRSVVGLGDSVPAGTACACTDFVRLVATSIARAQGSAATATNLAVGGETSSGLLQRLGDPATRRAVRGADLVLVTIGANDFDSDDVTDDACAAPTSAACYQADLAALSSTMREVLGQVGRLTDGQVVVTGYWNVFLDGRVGRAQGSAYVRNSDALTKAVNTELQAVAAQGGATYVDVYRPFKGDGDRDDTILLAADGDHPDAQGHVVIANAITTALTPSRTSSS